jgi:polyhydroxybutyrate depolymerase
MWDGEKERLYRLHVPTNYKKDVAAPLIAVFHGWGGNENEFLGNKTVRSLADQRGYILVAPRGLGSGDPDYSYNSWTFGGSDTGVGPAPESLPICDDNITPDYSYNSCNELPIAENSCSWTHCQSDDVAFAIALVQEIEAQLCVDTTRVFATGGSNGGMFTWELGQNPVSASTFRAIAPLIGLPHRGYDYPQGKPDGNAGYLDMPVLVITGTRDTTVPPGEWEKEQFTTTSNGNDRYYYTSATAITQTWAGAHDCDIGFPAEAFNDGNSKTDCRTYCTDDTGWPRVLDCRANTGHIYSLSWSWKLILNFFDAHSL